MSEIEPRCVDPRVRDSAVLDIGGDTGALIIYADAGSVGQEIEICRSGDLATRMHNVVRARRAPAGLVHAAVFPALYEGTYDVLSDEGLSCRKVVVLGGRVTEDDSGTRPSSSEDHEVDTHRDRVLAGGDGEIDSSDSVRELVF